MAPLAKKVPLTPTLNITKAGSQIKTIKMDDTEVTRREPGLNESGAEQAWDWN